MRHAPEVARALWTPSPPLHPLALRGQVTDHFLDAADELLAAKDGDARTALAAALALATGTTAPPAPRSLLSHADGYCTMVATFRTPVGALGFVWGALRKVLPDGTTEVAHSDGTR